MNDKEHTKTGPAHGHGPSKKVFDITRPGKVPASPTSRPIITTHKSPADDQFVSKGSADDGDDRLSLSKHKDLGLKPETGQPSEAAVQPEEPASAEDEQTPEAASPFIQADAETNTPELENDAPDKIPEDGARSSETPEAASAPEVTDDTALYAQEANDDMPEPHPVPAEHGQWPDPQQPEPTAHRPAEEQARHRPMSQDDVLAETDAPLLEHVIVSHHKAHRTKIWEWILILILMIIVAAAAVNFLLDAEILKTDLDIPHTDWLK